MARGCAKMILSTGKLLQERYSITVPKNRLHHMSALGCILGPGHPCIDGCFQKNSPEIDSMLIRCTAENQDLTEHSAACLMPRM